MKIKSEILKQFVPSNVCLQCDGCCRFKEKKSSWRPRMTSEEIKQAVNKGLAAEILSKEIFSQDGRIKTVSCGSEYRCSFFHPEDHTCGIYQARPFECQLYPFVLTRDTDGAGVYVHLNCPFVQQKHDSEDFERYVKYLKEFFAHQQVLDFLKRNPSLIGDYAAYREELEFMFRLPRYSASPLLCEEE